MSGIADTPPDGLVEEVPEGLVLLVQYRDPPAFTSGIWEPTSEPELWGWIEDLEAELEIATEEERGYLMQDQGCFAVAQQLCLGGHEVWKADLVEQGLFLAFVPRPGAQYGPPWPQA